MKFKLKDIADITMGQSPKGQSYNNKKDGKAFLQGRKTFGRMYPTIDTWTTEPKKIAKSGSVLMSVRAPVGDINIANDEICIGRGLCSINAKNGNNRYLYYLLLYNKANIIKKSSGTVFDSINIEQLEETILNVHKDKEQSKIVSVLNTIDEKIELNTQTNNNLYEIGKAIYQEYFENEKYTSSYEIKQLSEVTTNNRNKIDKTKEYKVLSAVNTGKLILSDDYFDKQVYSKDIGKYLNVNKNDFAYNPARINIGSIGLNDYDFNCCVSPVYVTFSVDKDYIDFFDFYFKSKRFNAEVTLRASGSVRQALNYNDFGMIEILYPSKEIINKFNKSYSKIKNRINKNKIKINNLEQIRDALLPKLMNGEIDLDKIEI